MKIANLHLHNVGPFKEIHLDFISEKNEVDSPPVIIITGENGTGKSIIIDSIRSLLLGPYKKIEREIVTSNNFLIQADIFLKEHTKVDPGFYVVNTRQIQSDGTFTTNDIAVNQLFLGAKSPQKYKRDFIIDYWTSKLSSDSFAVNGITSIDTHTYLNDALTGVHKNTDVTKAIVFFDYLKDSKDEKERNLGEYLFATLKNIVNLSIDGGEFAYVSRATLDPMIETKYSIISLAKLSSGNLYLIQRFISLLKQAYSICTNNNLPVAEIQNFEGLLLIDEAENHLHPKWQKVFLKNILSIFPKLQIIVTTHSPFIVSSIENARIYVCKGETDYATVKEETDFYANKPIEEILMSPLFNTNNFNSEISTLIRERKDALNSNRHGEALEIEKKLLEINPEYFNYLNIENLIRSIKK